MTKRKSYVIALIVLGLAIWLTLIQTILGDLVNPIITISAMEAGNPDRTQIDKTITNINDELTDYTDVFSKKQFDGDTIVPFLKGEYNTTLKQYSITVNMVDYGDLKQKTKQDVMQVTLDQIQNSDISATNRNKIYNFIAKHDETTSSLVRQLSKDVNADFASAYSWFKPFSGVVGWILGILTLALFSLLTLTILLDTAYIVLPAFQFWCTNATKEEKPKFVSREAVEAVKEAYSKTTSKEYVSPMSVYLKLKTKQLIVISICILYLVSGQIYTLVAWFIDSFAGTLPKVD